MINKRDLRSKIWGIYDYIASDLYFNRSDLSFRGEKYNATLLMSLLTGISGGKQLIVGEPGMGKTTSAEYFCALLYRLPLGTVWRAEVGGHPEQTEEKIIGRPDLGRLNQGEEVVRWSCFTLLPTKIVDEINRLPETKQSLILDGVDRGNWQYLNEAFYSQEFCLFATANYNDRGTHTIISPLLDRFDVIVESKHPGANLAYRVGLQGTSRKCLGDEIYEAEFHRLLVEMPGTPDFATRLEGLSERFGDSLAHTIGIQTLSKTDRKEINSQIRCIPLDLDANSFLRLVLSELSFCHPYGQKRRHEECEEGCHFSAYLCHATKGSISNRFSFSVIQYARALAWSLGDNPVELDHLITVLPYCLAHRIRWKQAALGRWDGDRRNDPLPIYMAKRAVQEMHRRYTEQAPQIKAALAAAFQILEGESHDPIRGDHPLYWDILRDLEITEN